MAKIDSYSLDSSITDNDSVLGIDSASGATKRFTMSSIKAALLEGADITAVIAGTGLSGGATSGEATLNIDSTVVTLTGTQTLTNKTLTTPVISSISNSGTITLPTSSDTLVGRATTDTLTNKTLTTPTITTPIINAGAQLKNGATSAGFIEFFEDSDNGTNKVTLIGPAATADVTITLPAATDTLVGKTTTDTLTNKTLTSPSLADPTFNITETNIADGDKILFLDATGSSVTKKEGVDDLAVLFAGAGLTAANAILAVGAGTGITVNANDVAVAGAQTSITSVLNTSLVLGRDADNDIDFTSDNIITLRTAGADQVKLIDGALSPVTDSDVDLGTSSLYFKDAYIDSITTTGNVTTGGALSVSDNNITNVGDIALDSISADATDINIAVTDNSATAFTIKQGSDAYLIVDTANSSESVSIGTGISGTAITIGHGTSETTIGDNLVVTGNLTVQGDTTTVNTATLSVEDPLVVVGSGNNSSDSVDLGLYGLYDTSGSQDLYSGLFRDASDSGKWKLFKDLQPEPTTTVNTSGTGYAVGTLVANLEGTVTGNASGLSATLAVASGGTNATSFADKAVIISQDSGTDTLAGVAMSTNGQLLIGGTSGPAAATLTAGSNVTITNADNAITLDVSAAGDAFKTISVSGQSDVVADGTADTLTFAAGTGTTITTNASTDTITISAGTNTIEVDEFTGNGSTTAYTLSTAAVTENNLLVYMDGVYQHHNTYAVSGTTLTFDTNVPNGSKVEAYHMITVSNTNLVQSAVAGTLMDVSGATGDVTFNVDLSEAAEEAIANGDYMLFLDGGATGVAKKEAVADIATLFAGTGLTASSSVINMDAAQTGITSVLNTSLVLGRDADNQIKFGTDNQIIFEVSGGDNVIFKASGEIEATSLDISGDVDIDGTLEADAITVNGTTLAETISDTVGAMVGSNTETGIAVTYDDSDNTLDFVIGAGTIVNSMLADNAVGTDEIAADAITSAKIADNALDSEHYTDGSIDTAHLAADSVTGAKIADDALDSEHYTDGSIDTAHLADGSITAAKIADGTIVAAEIADNAVTTAKINADAVTGAKIADDAINSEHYTDGSIDTAHIADSQVTTAKIADNNITHDKLENRYTVLSALGTGTNQTLDFSAATTFTATMNGNATFTITNPKQGQVVDLILAGNHTPTLAMSGATFNKVGSVDYDGSTTNLIQILVADDASSEIFYYSVAPIASDTTP